MPKVSKKHHDKAMVICDMHYDKDSTVQLNLAELSSLNGVINAYLCNDPDSCSELDVRELERLKTENNV